MIDEFEKATDAAIVCAPFIRASDTSSLILSIIDRRSRDQKTEYAISRCGVIGSSIQRKVSLQQSNFARSTSTNSNKMPKIRFFLLTTFSLGLLPAALGTPTPALMYHGMGDTSGGSISEIKTFLEEEIPGIYVTSIRMGNNTEEDFLSSYFMNLNQQVRDK